MIPNHIKNSKETNPKQLVERSHSNTKKKLIKTFKIGNNEV